MNKKGFTLVELLVVIVVLTVIALITVPRFNSMFDNSKIEIVKDSFYGYSRAVSEFVYHNMMNKENVKLNGTYSILSNGNLFYDGTVYNISFDGVKPVGGELVYSNNELVSGCLTINSYKVLIVDGEVSSVIKGFCN